MINFLKYIKQKYLFLKYFQGNNIDYTVIFSNSCKIGKNVTISSKTYVGDNVTLKDNSIIGGNVTLRRIELGEYSWIEGNVIITGSSGGKIKIGQNCYIGISNILDMSNDIIIGDFVHIAGPSSCLWTHTSYAMCLNSIPLNQQNEKYRPTATINIENNVYIGPNCTIYPGITIGHHSIIAPNSAVSKDVLPYTMVGGVPAKFIKNIEL